MRSKEVRTAIIGFFLVSTVLVEPFQIPADFFVNPETGELHVVIIVGSTAASADIVSAAVLAAALGAEPCPRAVHSNIPLLSTARSDTILLPFNPFDHHGFPTVDVPDSHVYVTRDSNSIPITYTLNPLWYFDCPSGFWGNGNGSFDPWETHEEIQVRFDIQESERCVSQCLACLYGGYMECMESTDRVECSRWYDVPGLIYRIDNIFVPPSFMVKMRYQHPLLPHVMGTGPGDIYTVPDPWFVMENRLPQITLFNTFYTVVDGGAVLDINYSNGEKGSLYGTPFLITGEPHFEPSISLYVHESLEFGSYTIELMDVNLSKRTAHLDLYEDGEILDSFSTIPHPDYGFPLDLENGFPFDSYETYRDLNDNGELDPGEITNITGIDYDLVWDTTFEKWITGYAEKDVWVGSWWEYYVDEHDDAYVLFEVVDMVIDCVELFTDDKGIGMKIQVYWLENEKTWYNWLCCDPWALESSYQLFLDAYQAGWDNVDSNSGSYQPPGTGLWPQEGFEVWRARNSRTCSSSMYVGNGFLDANDGHIGYEYYCLTVIPGAYFPEQHDFDRDGNTTNDCITENGVLLKDCTDKYDIEDPAVWHGCGPIVVEINICLCDWMCCASEQGWLLPGPSLDDSVYFALRVVDANFCDDGITYDTIVIDAGSRGIQSMTGDNLVISDSEFDFEEWKSKGTYNLILIGGPRANAIVRQLVGEGISTVRWESSPGQWEYISAPFKGCDVLIVAGTDRDGTSIAVHNLIEYLQSSGNCFSCQNSYEPGSKGALLTGVILRL